MSSFVFGSNLGLPFFITSPAAPAPFDVATAGSLPAASVVADNLGEPAASLSSPAVGSILDSGDDWLFAVVDLFVCDPVAYGAWCGSGFQGAWPVPAGCDPAAGFGSDLFPGTQAFVLCAAGVPGGIAVVGADTLDGEVAGYYCLPDLAAAPAFVPFSVPGCRFARKEPCLANLPLAGQPGASRDLVAVSVVAEVVLAWSEFRRWSADLLLSDMPWLASRSGLLREIAGGYDGLSVILVRSASLNGAAVGGVLVDPSGYAYGRYACRLLPSVAILAIAASAAIAESAAAAAPDPVPAPAAVPSYPLSLEMDAAAAAAAEEAELAVRVAVRSAVAGLEFDLLAAAGSLDPEILSVLSSLAPNDLVVSGLGSVAAAAYESAVAAARAFLVAVAAAVER